MHMRRAFLTPLAATLFSAASSQATIEPPPVTDARNTALGGTGVAYTHNGAALFHNPAGLAGIEQGALTLSISPLASWISAPLAQPNVSEDSTTSLFPMFLVGGGYRVADDWVVGMAVYPTVGFGASYKDVAALGGAEMSSGAAMFEASPGVSYSITDDVALGLSYRATYMTQTVKTPVPAPTEQELSGFSFLGAQLGLWARVAEQTRLGVAYRSKVTVDLSGTTTTGGADYDTESKFSSPHQFKLGIAQGLLEEKLLLALDLRYSLYKKSNQNQTITMTVPGVGDQAQIVQLDWKNTFTAATGVEYRFAPDGVAVRLGYSLSQSATPKDRPQPFFLPPGFMHSIHTGVGTTLSNLDLDLGGYYGWSKKTVDSPAEDTIAPGTYKAHFATVAISGTYRM